MDVMLILTALLMFISWVNPIIATAISREGGRMPIAKYIPVSPRTQLWAKLSVSLTINGAAILLMGIAVAALLGTHYLGAVLGADGSNGQCAGKHRPQRVNPQFSGDFFRKFAIRH